MANRRVARLICLVMLGLPAGFAQTTGDAMVEAPVLPPEHLNNLVAPIALYPDPLLSQVLSASTYPLEIVQAHQWLGRNGNLQGAPLMEAAKQQNWDPSVQAMVAFPNALALLANDIRWTTDLGNAFLAQQADVMAAVQRMRARARANGRLTSTPQQVVTVAAQGSQEAIEILPADPQVIYVPVYQPSYVWGPPVWGVYPDIWYPSGFSLGFGFGPAYYMSSYYPSWGGWGGWGWSCGWFGGGLSINVGFFNRYGYYGGGYGHYGGYYGGRSTWAHNPSHRWGVPYSNHAVSNRYGGDRRGGGNYAGGNYGGATRGGGSQWTGGRSDSGRGGSGSGQWQRFSDSSRTQSAGRSVASGFARSGDSGSGWSTRGGAGSYSAPRTSTGMRDSGRGGYSTSGAYSAPRTSTGMRDSGRGGYSTSGSYSAPRTSTGMRDSGRGGYSTSGSYSAPRTSTGMSSQGYSAPRSSYSGSRDSGRGGFSAPGSTMGSSPGFSSPRSFSGQGGFGGSSGFSSGRMSGGGSSGFSAGRSSGGGGGGFSGGRSGGGGGGSFSGGRSGGGGGGSRGR